MQFLFIEIFIGVIIFENCNKIHNIHVNENLIVGAWYFMRHYWVLTYNLSETTKSFKAAQ